MQRRDLIIGGIVLVVIAGIVFFVQRQRQGLEVLPTPTASATPTIEETQQQIEDKFKVQIPENVEKANLIDLTDNGYSGIATRKFASGIFDLTVLADLPDPQAGTFYQVFLKNDNQTRNIGRMGVAKGGYLLDVSMRENLSDFNTVIVALQTKAGNQIEQTILQGSF